MLIHRNVYHRIHIIGVLIALFAFIVFTAFLGAYAFHYSDKQGQLPFIVAFWLCLSMTLVISFKLAKMKADEMRRTELEEPIYSEQV
jgi:hypothetical protein